MTPVGSFMRSWAILSLLTLGYAVADYVLYPDLRYEAGLSMQPDPARALELLHWGGRLYSNGAWLLLFCNALLVGGLLALAVISLLSLWRRRSDPPSSIPRAVSSRPSHWPSG